MVELSPQQIISCDITDGGCNGGDLLTVFKRVMDAGGIDSDADYPVSSNGGDGGIGYLYGYYCESEQKHLAESKFRLISELEDLMTCSSFKKVREMMNNLSTRLEEEASSEAEHKGWCDTELTTNTQTIEEKTATVEKLHAAVDELEVSMEKIWQWKWRNSPPSCPDSERKYPIRTPSVMRRRRQTKRPSMMCRTLNRT